MQYFRVKILKILNIHSLSICFLSQLCVSEKNETGHPRDSLFVRANIRYPGSTRVIVWGANPDVPAGSRELRAPSEGGE